MVLNATTSRTVIFMSAISLLEPPLILRKEPTAKEQFQVRRVFCFSIFPFAKSKDERRYNLSKATTTTKNPKRLQSCLNDELDRSSWNLPKQSWRVCLEALLYEVSFSQLASDFIKLLLANLASEYRCIDYSLVNKTSLNHKMSLKGPLLKLKNYIALIRRLEQKSSLKRLKQSISTDIGANDSMIFLIVAVYDGWLQMHQKNP